MTSATAIELREASAWQRLAELEQRLDFKSACLSIAGKLRAGWNVRSPAELVRQVVETFNVSDRTARAYVADAGRDRRHLLDGKSVKCILLEATNRPRREVYPDQPGNRDVVWLTLTEEGGRLCKR